MGRQRRRKIDRRAWIARQGPAGSVPVAAGRVVAVLAQQWTKAYVDSHTHGLLLVELDNGVMQIRIPVPPALLTGIDPERAAAFISNYAADGLNTVARRQNRDPGPLPLALGPH